MVRISYKAQIGSKKLMNYDEELLVCDMCQGGIDTDRDIHDAERDEWVCMKCN